MNDKNRPICPLTLSYKIRDVRNFEYPKVLAELEAEPRYLELLWFIQFVSMPEHNPGGLNKFAADFITNNLDKIGSLQMLEAQSANRFNLEHIVAIHNELPVRVREKIQDADLLSIVAGASQEKRKTAISCDRYASTIQKATLEKFRLLAIEAAKDELANYLRSLCEEPSRLFGFVSLENFYWDEKGSPWFWPGVCGDLLTHMAKHEEECLCEIAETRVTKEVFRWLRMSRECAMPVWLNGSSRFGKTEGIRAFAKARPGLYRVIETPENQAIISLYKAIAKKLGILSDGLTSEQFRSSIELVMEASGVELIFDEAHFMYGTRFTKNTRPQRLDFIRRTMIDAGYPVAFISTPQSYTQARKKFERATSYTFEQWDGRLLTQEVIQLPEEISHEEILAVAAIHMPGMGIDYLEVVARRATSAKGSVYASVKSIAKVAWYLARQAGRKTPKLDDIKEAAASVLPSPAESSNTPVPAEKKPARGKLLPEQVFPNRTTKPETLLTARRADQITPAIAA